MTAKTKIIKGDLVLKKNTVFDRSLKVMGNIRCEGGFWGLTVKGNVCVLGNIDVRDIKCLDIDCHDVNCDNIKADNINVLDINAHNIDALDIDCHNIDAWNVYANSIKAWNINVDNIDVLDISARNIDAWDIKCLVINAWDIISESVKLKKGGKVLAYSLVENRSSREKKVLKEAV